jgi:hypothetical protein
MKVSLLPILSTRNSHIRDKNIEFFEKEHKYIVLSEPTVKYTSVTTWNHGHFKAFNADNIIKKMMEGKNWNESNKYWGMTPQQIKAQWNSNGASVSSAGTNLHYDIECFYNNSDINCIYTNKELYENYIKNNGDNHSSSSLEWQYFINFIKDHPHLKPYRTEWIIYHEDVEISGSIDMIFENPDGTLSIYDWKRVKAISKVNNFNDYALTPEITHLPNTNYWHYSLQLNTYKTILEQKYDKIIKELVLVILHPESTENNYELITLPDLSKEVNDMFVKRIKKCL